MAVSKAKKKPAGKSAGSAASAKKLVAKKASPLKKAVGKKAVAPNTGKSRSVPAKKLPAKAAPAAAKKVTAKKAVPAKGQRPTRVQWAQAQPLSVSEQGKLAELTYRMRKERIDREETLSDVVIVRADDDLAADSPEVQTVAALSQGNLSLMLAAAEPGKAPKIDIVRRLGAGMAMRANDVALSMVRRSSPGLRMFSATYLYVQHVRPLGAEFETQALTVGAAAQVTKLAVQLQDPAGKPIADVKVTGLLDFLGTNVSVRTDATGVATLEVPVSFPRIELIMAEPDHSHWSQFAKGFDRASAPATLGLTLTPLLVDGFHLMANYAAHDPVAGQSVTVGVIDSGVGPHVDLTVVGGMCVVTGDDATDFADNGIGHGTHVAGIIAARQSAGGLYGVAPACKLMSYRVCPKNGNKERAESVDVAAAIEQAIIDGCDMVNISLGSLQAMPELAAVLEKARNAGMVVFAATGNDGQGLLRYPARYSQTMSVGALGRDATFPTNTPETFNVGTVRSGSEFVATFSNHGVGTDFIGVGVAVLSTYPNDRYAMMSGTSMATPFITGMTARLLSRSPNLLNMARGPARVDAIIAMSCQSARIPSWAGEFGSLGVLV